MSYTYKTILTGVLLVALAACDSSNYLPAPPVVVVPPPPPPAMNTDFTQFVKSEYAKDANSEPAEVNEITFDFNDQENEEAFNDLLNN